MTEVGFFLFGVGFGAAIMFALCVTGGIFVDRPRDVSEDGKQRLRELGDGNLVVARRVAAQRAR